MLESNLFIDVAALGLVNQCNKPGVVVVVVPVVVVVEMVVVVGQTGGPLMQVEHVLRLVQLVYQLHIPLEESNVKSVQDWAAEHASWHSHADSVMSEVRIFPVHRPMSKQSLHSVTDRLQCS